MGEFVAVRFFFLSGIYHMTCAPANVEVAASNG